MVICDSRALCHSFQSFSSTSTIYTKVGRISSLYQAMTLLKFSRNLCPYDDRERRLQCAGINEFRSNSKPPSDSLGSLANVKREYSVEGSKGWSEPWDGSFKYRLAHPLSKWLREWHLGLLYKKLPGNGQTQGKSAMAICVCCVSLCRFSCVLLSLNTNTPSEMKLNLA